MKQPPKLNKTMQMSIKMTEQDKEELDFLMGHYQKKRADLVRHVLHKEVIRVKKQLVATAKKAALRQKEPS